MKDAAGGARCDPAKPFGAPTPVPNINSSLDETSFSLTQDETLGFVTRKTQTGGALLMTRRGADAAFGSPNTNATAAINAAGSIVTVSSGTDGLAVYLGTQGKIFVATRADATSSFDAGTAVTINGVGTVLPVIPKVSADGQTLYFYDNNAFSGTRSATREGTGQFGSPRLVTAGQLGAVSADELTIFYYAGTGVKTMTRASKADAFSNEVAVDSLSGFADNPMAVTADGCILYFSSNRPNGVGGIDIWESHRPN
jgi:hypothetical protein